MPFTLAHGAAAIPFRRIRLVTSALLVGTFAPDFEYFLRMTPDRGFGHTVLGTLVLTLPLALLVLWIFHSLVKRPAAGLMPDEVRSRLAVHLGEFRFGGPARFLVIVGSILLGIATHVLWDSFTHRDTWAYHRWPVLRQSVHLPVLGLVPYYKVLQHGSTIVGIAAVFVWLGLWYRASERSLAPLPKSPTPARRITIAMTIVTVALAGAITRAIAGAGVAGGGFVLRRFAGELSVTLITLAWWQLVAYGLFCLRNSS